MTETPAEPMREDSPIPLDAGEDLRAMLLAVPVVRVQHHWADNRMVGATVVDEAGNLLATIDRIFPVRPEARFLWILGDVKTARYYVRTTDGRLLWEVLRKPHVGGVKADLAPVPQAGVARAVRGMPWTRTDYALQQRGGGRIGQVRWLGGLRDMERGVVDNGGRTVLETFDHAPGPWSDYSVRWLGDAAEPLRTVGFVTLLTLHTGLTKLRN